MEQQSSLDLDVLVREHLPALRGFLASFGAHSDLIDDMAQEVFLEVIKNQQRYDGSRPFRSWLFGIARNLINNEFRRNKTHARIRRGLAAQALRDFSEQPDERLLRSEAMGHLQSCLQQLSDRARTLVELRFGEHLSGEEISQRLAVKHGSVRMGLLRARAALRSCLDGKLSGEQS